MNQKQEILKIMENLLPYQGELYLMQEFMEMEKASALFEKLRNTVPWQQKMIRIFGRSVPEPRLTAWIGDPDAHYRYSGISLQPLPWPEVLKPVRKQVEARCETDFNSVLLNYYRHGSDSMGWHRDNEKELGSEPVIASLSLGAVRPFLIRTYRIHDNLVTLMPQNGSLMVMRGETQHFWEHSLPKRKALQPGRISLTFRKIIRPD